jgi:hypothetical protein
MIIENNIEFCEIITQYSATYGQNLYLSNNDCRFIPMIWTADNMWRCYIPHQTIQWYSYYMIYSISGRYKHGLYAKPIKTFNINKIVNNPKPWSKILFDFNYDESYPYSSSRPNYQILEPERNRWFFENFLDLFRR